MALLFICLTPDSNIFKMLEGCIQESERQVRIYNIIIGLKLKDFTKFCLINGITKVRSNRLSCPIFRVTVIIAM